MKTSSTAIGLTCVVALVMSSNSYAQIGPGSAISAPIDVELKEPAAIFADPAFPGMPIWKPLAETEQGAESGLGEMPVGFPTIILTSAEVPTGPATTADAVSATIESAAPAIDPKPETAPTETNDTTPTLTLEECQRRLSALEQQTDLDEDRKNQTIQSYQRAMDSLKLLQESAKRSNELKTERDQGPESIKTKRAELAAPLENDDLDKQNGRSISELEQAKLTEDELAAEAIKSLESWETRAKVRAERKPQMPAIIEKTKQQIEDAKAALQAPPIEGEHPAMTQARNTEQKAFLMLLQQQLEQYRIEQSRYEALHELFPLQRDLLVRKKNYHEKRLGTLKDLIVEARRIETERQAREAREKLKNTHPALRELAEKNATLTEQRKKAQADLKSASQVIEDINSTYADISKKYQDIVDKESLGALSSGVGMLLRNQRNQLPATSQYHKHRRFAEQEISRLQLEILPLRDERDELGDIENQLASVLNELGDVHTISDEEINNMARGLLLDRSHYLDDLISDYSAVMSTYAEIDAKGRLLVEKIREYENFIDERVLWVRSAATISLGTFPRALSGWTDLFSLRNLMGSWKTLSGDVRQFTWVYVVAAIASLVVLGLSRSIQTAITRLTKGSQGKLTSNVISTLSAIGLTLLSASVVPGLLWLTGWRLTTVATDDFTKALGTALETTAIACWSMEFFRQLCRKRGIAVSFLEWPANSMTAARGQLLVLMGVGLPLMFLTAFADGYNEGYWADSVGRLAFVTFSLVLAFIASRMLHPKGKILGNLLNQKREGLMYRSRWVWYSCVMLAPITLGMLSLYGYHYTAEQLLIRLQFTFWLSISIVIAYSIVTQWMLVARKQLAMEHARARRAAALAASQEKDGQPSSSPVPTAEIPQVDLSEVNQQVIKFVRVIACVVMVSGCWMIWSQVMPALQVFNRVELWSTTVQVTETVEIGDGQDLLQTVTQQKWITLGDLLLACGIVSVAVLASKNLPGLLELSILQKLPLDHGERNAITTLCRYACILMGMIFGCRQLGIGWSSVQWLVAALTVGLGFGLQEIFANFISGLIILFERPIRIGDVVTIDNVTGSVSRIQIRATTITDWDRKEYIVPNKEFVTGRLLNWTLSDKTNRVVIPVGVAYGSDTDKALELLTEVANNHPVVLKDPAPIASFEGFGDSTLSLNLRAYLPSLDNRLKVISELHREIDIAFRKAQIEIAFPQMDLHLRTPEVISSIAMKERSSDAKAA